MPPPTKNMAAVPALLMLTHTLPDAWSLVIWFTAISVLGVFAAIPIKRQLVNIEALPFPTGTATAETLRSLHSHGSGGKAEVLGTAAVGGALLAWLRDARLSWMSAFNIPGSLHFPGTIRGVELHKWTVAVDFSLILVGAGALMSWKTGWSLLLGGVMTYLVLAPVMVDAGVIQTVTYKGIVGWSVWPGAAMLVSSGVLSFAFQWRSVARSFTELIHLLTRTKGPAETDPMTAVECPSWWFPAGFAVVGPVVVFLMYYLFNIPIWAGVVAIPLSLVMGVVAARVTGETDVTPTKALGPVTQLTYGALLPGDLTANIMSANVTGGVGLHAADLLTDLKSGFLVGANPRQQFIAQLFGVLAGAAVVVPAFNLLVPTADVLGSEQFPAPSVMVWAGVSKALSEGLEKLHETARIAALIGFVTGIVLVLLEKYGPRSIRPFVPSPSGVGVAMVMPGFNAASMFLGALLAELARRFKPQAAEKFVTPVASGLIAGESLMGILIALLLATGMMGK